MDNKAWAQGVAKKIKEKEIEVIKKQQLKTFLLWIQTNI